MKDEQAGAPDEADHRRPTPDGAEGGDDAPREVPAPGQAAFDEASLQQDLRGRAVRGGAATMLTQISKFVVTIVGTLWLARQLFPDDLGLVGMVLPLTAFIAMMRDMGLSWATIQRRDLRPEHVNALFWVNVLVTAVLVGLTCVAAPFVARFYGRPELTMITLALAVTMFAGGVSAQHAALIRREMRFLELGGIEVFGLFAGYASGIVAAGMGAGPWALVLTNVVREVVISSLVIRAAHWRPGRPQGLRAAADMIRFGGYMSGSRFLDFSAGNVDKILVGSAHGSAALGLYSMGFRLLLMPLQQLRWPMTSVAVPVLSRAADDPERFARIYLRGILLLASAGLPVVTLTAGLTDRVVLVLLGDKWSAAIDVFRLLAPAGFIMLLAPCSSWIFVSLGQGRRQLLVKSIGIPIVLLGVVIGLPHGIEAVAIGYSVGFLLMEGAGTVWALRGSPVALPRLLTTIARPVAASVAAGAAAAWVSQSWGRPLDDWLALAALVAMSGLVYAAIWIGLPGGRREVKATMSLMRELRG